MQLLHETPVLGRDAIRTALAAPSPVNGGGSLPPSLQELSASGLAEQIEQIKITLQSLNTEEMSKLWTALQAHYRPTSAYVITVVLIEAAKPTRSPLPVLVRGPADHGVMAQPDLTPPFPTLVAATPPSQQSSAHLGDTLTLDGHHLDGADLAVRFCTSPRLSGPITRPPLAGNTATRLQVTIPAPAQWAAGLYSVAVMVQRPGETFARATNELPLALAPRITSPMPMSVSLGPGGDAVITWTARLRSGRRRSCRWCWATSRRRRNPTRIRRPRSASSSSRSRRASTGSACGLTASTASLSIEP
jgi:hypothetical protein